MRVRSACAPPVDQKPPAMIGSLIGAPVARPEERVVDDPEHARRHPLHERREQPERHARRADRLGGAAREDEAQHAVRARLGGLDRDVPAQRQPDDERPARRGLRVDRGRDGVHGAVDRERLRGAGAVPGQVHRHAAIRRRQAAELRQPLGAGQPRAVDEHDRGRRPRADGRPVRRAGRRPGHGRAGRVGGRAPLLGARRRLAARTVAATISSPCARSPTGPPACGWRGRACRGCSRRASARCAR